MWQNDKNKDVSESNSAQTSTFTSSQQNECDISCSNVTAVSHVPDQVNGGDSGK